MSHTEFLSHMSKILEVPDGSLSGTEKLEDMNWDSVAMMSFISLVDEHAHMTLSPRQLTNAESVNDLGRLIGVSVVA